MARFRRTEDDDVSLFPFLSVIAAVIGVLTLMIAAVTLGQMNQDDVKEAVKNAIEMENIQQQTAASENEIQELKLQLEQEQAELLSSANARENELVKTRAELDSLLKQLAEEEQRVAKQKETIIVIPEVPQNQRETLGDMQSQLEDIQQRLALLQKDLQQRKKPADEATVSILPGGSGITFVPNFVECTAGAIVLHNQQPPLRIRLNEVAANKKFVALLNQVANAKQQSIIFLVRSDGLQAYRTVRGLCQANDVRNGKLPVVGNGRLDFSHFNNK